MSPRKVESRYLCTHGAACSNWGTTINGKFQDSKLFSVIPPRFCSSQSFTDVSRQQKIETFQMWRERKHDYLCSIYTDVTHIIFTEVNPAEV